DERAGHPRGPRLHGLDAPPNQIEEQRPHPERGVDQYLIGKTHGRSVPQFATAAAESNSEIFTFMSQGEACSPRSNRLLPTLGPSVGVGLRDARSAYRGRTPRKRWTHL